MEDDDEFFDDWLIKSLKSYKHLHMYELSQPTSVIEWSGRNGVCVAGCSDDTRNEILEMRLPGKMATDTVAGETARPTRDRDFKMVGGGFSDRPIHCLAYLRGTSPRHVVTGSHECANLDVWQLDTESSDVIKRVSSVAGREAAGRLGIRGVTQRPHRPMQIAFGSAHRDLQIYDIETSTTIASDFGEGQNVIQMKFLNENELVTCCSQTGVINIHDLRLTSSQSAEGKSATLSEKKPVATDTPQEADAANQSHKGLDGALAAPTNRDSSTNSEVSWTFDLRLPVSDLPDGEDSGAKKARLDVAAATVVRMCSDGNLIISDVRNPHTSLQSVQLDGRKMTQSEPGSLIVKWCPTERDLISVSGLNGSVDIYDISTWPPLSTSAPSVQPVFTHQGHMMGESSNQTAGILCHTWHPEYPRVVMSSGSDGSLHAWDWSTVA